jgi:nucleotide sugar dehydrogenase
MESLKEAEAVKVVENSFRDINIAFVNELAMSFHKLGINVENVIDGAATKPFAFMPHHPGCGVGGHCIPVDPYYLIEYAHDYGFEHTFLMQAREINESMPKFTVSLLIESLAEISMEPDTARVALLGLSYKANVGDDRESPSYEILNLLKELQVDISVYDPYIAKLSTASSLSEALRGVDAVVITTAHKDFLDELTIDNIKASDIKVLIDGRNLLRHLKNDLITAGIKYQGIGL